MGGILFPTRTRDMSINISIGRYGGFYIHRGNSLRICLGWIAFTFMNMELEDFAERQYSAGFRRGIDESPAVQ